MTSSRAGAEEQTGKGKISPPPDWVPPSRAFFIASPPRAGSTLLSLIMRGAGCFGKPNEYFNRTFIQRRDGGDLPSFEQCFEFAATRGRRRGVVGVKFHAQHLKGVDEACELEAWFPKRSWVRLDRRDLLGQAISFSIALQTDAWVSHAVARGEPRYDGTHIADALEQALADEEYLHSYFAGRDEDVIHVTYEDFESRHQRTADVIAARFGVRARRLASTRPVQIEKQRTTLNDEWRQRFLEENADAGLTARLEAAVARSAAQAVRLDDVAVPRRSLLDPVRALFGI